MKLIFVRQIIIFVSTCFLTLKRVDVATKARKMGGRARLVLLCLSLILSFNIFGENKLEITDPSQPIVVTKDESTFSIILESNPTTGYFWELGDYDKKLVIPIEHKFYPPSNKTIVGAPGYEKWIFQIRSEGFVVPQNTIIKMIYMRPWEKEPAKIVEFNIFMQAKELN